MFKTYRQGLFAKQHLIAQEMSELEDLVALSQKREQLLLPLDYQMLKHSGIPTDDIFLYYQDSQLVGCLLLDRFHSALKEVVGLVHPDWRRRGIFSQLLSAARKECQSRGISRLLFLCEATSSSGQAFLQSVGAGREFAEHHMLLSQFQPRFQHDDHLLFREAFYEDREELSIVMAADFDNDKERALQHILRALEQPGQRFYLASYGGEDLGCAEPVGTLRFENMPQEHCIYGFFVRPAYRGRGHGRQILEEAIVTVRSQSQKPVTLWVDTNNHTAINLYRSTGFSVQRTYEYYGLDIL